MIRIVGDTHGDTRRMADLDMQLKSGDYLLVCGDFGYVFLNDVFERRFLDDLEYRPYTILFVDGNHENFDVLESFPEESWNGGRVHRLRKNILHLQRGQVFEIAGKSFFTFGGGYSIDKAMRVEGYSWWPQELPTDAQYKEGNENLAKHGKHVDYISRTRRRFELWHSSACTTAQRNFRSTTICSTWRKMWNLRIGAWGIFMSIKACPADIGFSTQIYIPCKSTRKPGAFLSEK